MSSKSLVAAKVLGGGVAGAGGIAGAGIGLTKYFKSEESDISKSISPSESQPTEVVTTGERSVAVGQKDSDQLSSSDDSLTGKQVTTVEEGLGVDGKDSGKSQDSTGTHVEGSVGTQTTSPSEARTEDSKNPVTPQGISEQRSDDLQQTPSSGSDGNSTDVASPKSIPETSSPVTNTGVEPVTDSEKAN